MRRLLQNHNLSPEQIIGSGRSGRITAKDVEKYLENLENIPQPQLNRETVINKVFKSQMVPHSPIRLRTAQHMVESMLNTAPHVTAVFEADLSKIVAHRKVHKNEYAAKGVKLTFTAYFIYAVVEAIRAVPEVNSRWHEKSLEIFNSMNIGIAAATPAGLIVPVLQNAEEMSLFGIAQNLQLLTEKRASES